MTKEEFNDFFRSYALNVDNANQLNFWKLSDALIFEIIKQHIPDPGEGGLILDAGGGTARWAILLSAAYRAQFTVLDLSEDMLKKAQENVERAKLEKRISLRQGDLTDMQSIADESVHHAVSIYSPISFIGEKGKMAGELYRVLRPGGRVLVMGHGYFNALASKINNYHASVGELHSLEREKLVKWAPNVPILNVFSKESMEQLFSEAGFTPLKTFGVPVFVQPGAEDFDQKNEQQSSISQALKNEDFFRAVFDIEMAHNANPSVANRGMNIFALFEKK